MRAMVCTGEGRAVCPQTAGCSVWRSLSPPDGRAGPLLQMWGRTWEQEVGPRAGDTCMAIPGGLPGATVVDTATVRPGSHIIWAERG